MSDRVISPSTGGLRNNDENAPLPIIQHNRPSDDTISEVTDQSQGVHVTQSSLVESPGIGQPATPPIRSFKNMEESSFEAGYDSDDEIGPFFD